jgi:FkbH-like protein
LDNTLWGGILGEDGVDGILLSGSYPGKAFHLWQEGLKELQKSGVMLAICSKNNISDVEEVWTNRDDMLLQKSDFVAMRINWQDKATNIRELSDELNIGLDSMVFVDDNPTERELIKQQLPEIAVPDFPSQPYGLMGLYKDLITNYFGVYRVTQEDRAKTEQYKANTQRRQQQAAFTNMEDYLQSLEMKLRIGKVSDATLQRVAQLTQKTNQFNLTGKRFTDLELKDIIERNGKVFSLSVKDKFGDSGLTGAAVVSLIGNEAHIDNLFLSCRILGRKIENTFVEQILLGLKEELLENVTAVYNKTPKNQLVENFYESVGFSVMNNDEQKKTYVYCLKKG